MWTPLAITWTLEAATRGEPPIKRSAAWGFICLFGGSVSTSVNPFIYGYMNKQVGDVMKLTVSELCPCLLVCCDRALAGGQYIRSGLTRWSSRSSSSEEGRGGTEASSGASSGASNSGASNGKRKRKIGRESALGQLWRERVEGEGDGEGVETNQEGVGMADLDGDMEAPGLGLGALEGAATGEEAVHNPVVANAGR